MLKTFLLDSIQKGKLVFAIAEDVRRAALKERMLYGFLLLAFLFILMANVPFMVKDPRVLEGQSPEAAAVQIGFAAINIFILLIAIFISMTTLQNYLAKEKIVLLLSKPVRRWQIIEGVIFGLCRMILLNWILMTGGIWLVIFSQTKTPGFYVWIGMSPTILMAFFYISLIVFFYSLFPNIMAGLLTFFVIIAGFGASLAHDVFFRASYPFLVRQALLAGLSILPKINALWGISMGSLKLFRIHVHPWPIFLHTIFLIFILNIFTAWKFRSFGRS